MKSLIGIKVLGQHGRDIGAITDMFADTTTWQLTHLEVKLNRSTLDELKLKKPWFGSQTVQVPVGEISGASDYLVLECLLEDMEFTSDKSQDVSEGPKAEVMVDSNDAPKDGSLLRNE